MQWVIRILDTGDLIHLQENVFALVQENRQWCSILHFRIWIMRQNRNFLAAPVDEPISLARQMIPSQPFFF
ncbi:hypothetical protein A3G69_05930 [Candidatus Peribacteria bacterium RIFCSPLOWO2_12_FULL_53_10]|nr:MAG: hypothetical protein A3G69_05930 [Candidatus Peribacteria bacterium RIFCSPLOWO2_12_FULL_53_10]